MRSRAVTRPALVLLLLGMLTVPNAPTASATQTLDLDYVAASPGGFDQPNWFGFLDFVKNSSMAQLFTATSNGSMTQVDLAVAGVTSSATVEVYATSSGSPIGSPIASGAVDVSAIPPTFGQTGWPYTGGTYTSVMLTPTSNLVVGDVYAVVLTPAAGTGGSLQWWELRKGLFNASSAPRVLPFPGALDMTGRRMTGGNWETFPQSDLTLIYSLVFGLRTYVGDPLSSAVAVDTDESVPILQQFAVPYGTTGSGCGDGAPASVDIPALANQRAVGWSVSYAEWPNDHHGGFVCTRVLTRTGGHWMVA